VGTTGTRQSSETRKRCYAQVPCTPVPPLQVRTLRPRPEQHLTQLTATISATDRNHLALTRIMEFRYCPVVRENVGDHEEETDTKGVHMAKFHARPSLQYRYEHYDPRMG
jgi:hypothetical protein